MIHNSFVETELPKLYNKLKSKGFKVTYKIDDNITPENLEKLISKNSIEMISTDVKKYYSIRKNMLAGSKHLIFNLDSDIKL